MRVVANEVAGSSTCIRPGHELAIYLIDLFYPNHFAYFVRPIHHVHFGVYSLHFIHPIQNINVHGSIVPHSFDDAEGSTIRHPGIDEFETAIHLLADSLPIISLSLAGVKEGQHDHV